MSILVFSLTSNLSKKPPIEVPYYSGPNWKRLNEIIDAGINNIYIPNNTNMSSSEVEAAVLGQTELLNKTVEEAVPK